MEPHSLSDSETNLQPSELIPYEYLDHYSMLRQRANNHFRRQFVEYEFGDACSISDRLWIKKDPKPINAREAAFVAIHFSDGNVVSFELCKNYLKLFITGNISTMSKTNGYVYPTKPDHLSKLNPITQQLISLRILLKQIDRRRRERSYVIVEQVINVPVDVQWHESGCIFDEPQIRKLEKDLPRFERERKGSLGTT